MAYLEREGTRVMDKFHREIFSLWKFKMKMVFVFMNLWDIVDGSEKTLSSNTDPKVLKEYQRHVKKAMFIIGPTWQTTHSRTSRVAKDMRRR